LCIVYAQDTHRENPTDGPVQSQYICNITEMDCSWQKKGEKGLSMMLAVGTFQKQDTTSFTIFGKIWNADILNNGIGILDLETFAKIMPANNIPLIYCGQTYPKSTQIDPTNQSHVISVNVECAEFFLREYVLNKCPKVSFGWVKEQFQVKPNDENAFIKREIHGRPCGLNQNNLNSASTFINNKIVNVSSYTGCLKDLDDQGCEWRVMHSVRNAPENISEQELANIPYKVIYGVMPLPDKKIEESSEQSDDSEEAAQSPKFKKLKSEI